MTERVLIVGGDAAGMSAASRLARSGADVAVTVFEREQVISYAACGMPYHLDDRIPDPGKLLIRSPADFAAVGVDVRTGHEVVGVDPARAEVTVRADGVHTVAAYDKLLIATGARAILPGFANGKLPNVFIFRRYADLLTLASHLDDRKPETVTVVGGGYVGIELAEVLTLRGIRVTLAEAAPSLMPGSLDPVLAADVADRLRRQGVTLRLGYPVEEIVTADGTARLVRTAEGAWECGAVIVGVGVRPASELAVAAGLPVGAEGAIVTDAALRTQVDGIWAAGDCTATTNLITGQRAWVPLGPTANKQGRVAADSILGLAARFDGVVGTALVKAFDLEIGRTGLTHDDAIAEGFDAVAAQVTVGDCAPYYPGGDRTTVRLIADRPSGRLLGGQVLGLTGVAGRTNVIATALQAGFDIERFSALDFGYAPPFAPVWDPLLVAANQLRSAQDHAASAPESQHHTAPSQS